MTFYMILLQSNFLEIANRFEFVLVNKYLYFDTLIRCQPVSLKLEILKDES